MLVESNEWEQKMTVMGSIQNFLQTAAVTLLLIFGKCLVRVSVGILDILTDVFTAGK
jgi:hypothetical protein